MDWKDFFDPMHPRDIAAGEAKFNLLAEHLTEMRNLAEPFLTVVKINEAQRHALLWHAVEQKQQFFFPISDPACEELECTNPSEWQIIFIGTIQQLRESKLHDRFKGLSGVSDEFSICLLVLREKMWGFGGRDMSKLIFPCTVIHRIEQGQDIAPKLYCNENWQPPEYPRVIKRLTDTQYI